MVRINFQSSRGYAWFSNESCHARGFLFDREGLYHGGESLVEYFSLASNEEDLHDRVSGANGMFSLVIELDGEFFLAQDIIRSLPLFYMEAEGEWHISDQAWKLKDELGSLRIIPEAELEFMGTGFVSGRETLLEGLFQVQAGEIVKLSGEVQRSFYFSYRVNSHLQGSHEELRRRGAGIFKETGDRLIAALKGRTAVVPLSGGYDSRMLATMLKKASYGD
jgi:asparagine synthase (glutamine-hydrolysing)